MWSGDFEHVLCLRILEVFGASLPEANMTSTLCIKDTTKAVEEAAREFTLVDILHMELWAIETELPTSALCFFSVVHGILLRGC